MLIVVASTSVTHDGAVPLNVEMVNVSSSEARSVTVRVNESPGDMLRAMLPPTGGRLTSIVNTPWAISWQPFAAANVTNSEPFMPGGGVYVPVGPVSPAPVMLPGTKLPETTRGRRSMSIGIM